MEPFFPEVVSDSRGSWLRSDPRNFCTIIISIILELKDARIFAWLSDAALDHRRVTDGEGLESALQRMRVRKQDPTA